MILLLTTFLLRCAPGTTTVGGGIASRQMYLCLISTCIFYAGICFMGPSINLFDGCITIDTNRIFLSLLVIAFIAGMSRVSTSTTISSLIICSILIAIEYLLLSNDLIITFLSLELINLSLYLILGRYASGIKYIITSLLMTSFMLLGIVLIYASNASTNLDIITLSSWPLLIVLALKLGIFPFHQLTAELYDAVGKVPLLLLILIKISIISWLSLQYLKLSLTPTTPLVLCTCLGIIIPAISAQYAQTFRRFIAQSSATY